MLIIGVYKKLKDLILISDMASKLEWLTHTQKQPCALQAVSWEKSVELGHWLALCDCYAVSTGTIFYTPFLFLRSTLQSFWSTLGIVSTSFLFILSFSEMITQLTKSTKTNENLFTSLIYIYIFTHILWEEKSNLWDSNFCPRTLIPFIKIKRKEKKKNTHGYISYGYK